MTYEEMEKFCGSYDHGAPKWQDEPITSNGRTIATDARIMVVLDSILDGARHYNNANADRLIGAQLARSAPEYGPVPEVTPERCETCTGHAHGFECEECWDGYIYGQTDHGEARYNDRYLAMIADLPEAECEKAPDAADAMRFKFKGGWGLLMPIRAWS